MQWAKASLQIQSGLWCGYVPCLSLVAPLLLGWQPWAPEHLPSRAAICLGCGCLQFAPDPLPSVQFLSSALLQGWDLSRFPSFWGDLHSRLSTPTPLRLLVLTCARCSKSGCTK